MAAPVRTAPRKQPRQARSQATIDAILTATARILVKDGFDRASTNRIAEAAGVSVGSLYQYFPCKEALVAALVERHIDQMTAMLSDAFVRLATLPVEKAARELVSLHLRAHAIDPRLHRVVSEQLPRLGRVDRVHDVEKQAMRMVRAYLEAHKREIKPKDLDLAAFVLVETVEGLTHAALLHGARVDDDKLIDEITALVVRYLGV